MFAQSTDRNPRELPTALDALTRDLAESGGLADAVAAVSRALASMPDLPSWALYTREPLRFVPAAHDGIPGAPCFHSRGAVATSLEHLGGPVMTVHTRRSRWLAGRLCAEERAALDELGTIALIPFFVGRTLAGFLALGGGGGGFDPNSTSRAVAAFNRCLDRVWRRELEAVLDGSRRLRVFGARTRPVSWPGRDDAGGATRARLPETPTARSSRRSSGR